MSDNRKYYYLKLKENYFDDDSIVLLESMQDGVLYSNILLKLYLKSLKHGGRLQLDEDIPYTAQMIATITRQQIGTVERALQIFLKLGLVEVLDSGTFYMSNIELLIGQSSTEAERKRAARLQNKSLSAPRVFCYFLQIGSYRAEYSLIGHFIQFCRITAHVATRRLTRRCLCRFLSIVLSLS